MSTAPETEEMPDSEVEQMPPEQVEVPVHGVLVVEGIETGDRRKFAEGAITWRDLPLPLLWAKANNGGHDGSVVVGRIEEITRAEDGTFPFSGFMNTTAEADECIGLLADRSLRGISVDIDDATLELQTRSGAEFDGDTDPDDVLEVLTKARVSAATIVPIPAFQEAFAALGEAPATGEVEEVDEEEVVTEFRDVSQQERDDLKDEGKALDDGSFPIANEEDLRNAIQSVGRAKDPEKAKRHIKKRAKDLDAEGLIPDDWAVVTEEFSGDAVAAQSVRSIVEGLPLPEEQRQQVLDATDEDVADILRSIAEDAPDPQPLLDAADQIAELLLQQEPQEPIAQATISEKDLTVGAAQVASLAADTGEFVDVAPGKTEDGPGWLTHPVDTDRLRDYWVRGPGAAKIAWGAPGDFNRCRVLLAEYVAPQHLSGYCANRHKDALGVWPGQHSSGTIAASAGEPVAPVYRLVASGGPALPPMDWFANPGLQEPTDITVTEDGQVFGHVATWGTCHVGFPGSCVTPPSSPSGYAYYCSGVVATDGGDVRVGQITIDTGHAGMQDNARQALAHYDNTGSAVVDVMAGEDEIGIWIAGAVRPGTTDEQIRTLRAAKLSGDWREIGGSLEMVGVLAVNVPGFPIPKPSLAASAGHQTALVAAGIVPEQTPVENFTVEEVVSATLAKIEADRVAREEIERIASDVASVDIERTLASMDWED